MSGNVFSEREIISRISEILGGVENDDCAVVDAGERYLVATTDMLHSKTDFPDIMNPWQMGWMTVAVNLSDIAAMGAQPAGVLIAAGLPPEADLYFIDELFSGFGDCAAYYGTAIIGGDTDRHDELTITAAALGFVEKDLVLRRRGAKPGDLLCTTGELGGAGGGLWAWQNSLESDLITKLLEPEPRLDEGRALARSRAVTAMMDNSDGLALSLSDLAQTSQVGFVVREEALPVAAGLVEMVGTEKAREIVMSAGGDFELVFTVRPGELDAARRACALTVIGEVVEEEGIWIEQAGHRLRIEPRGYEHRIGGMD